MIEVGKFTELKVLRDTSIGIYLGDESGEDVLLPNKYRPEKFKMGGMLRVYVYRDHEDRKVATNIVPKILLHEFSLLRVSAVTGVGAFMDWGMEKELIVPFNEQRQKMEERQWYVVYLKKDDTDRLYASNKLDKHLQNQDLTVAVGDAVDLVVYHESDLGYSVIINHQHKGLVYKNEVFQDLNIGDKLKGFVKKIREENKIDVSLQPIGYENFNTVNTQKLYDSLVQNQGTLSLTDKSSPDEIYMKLGISKKAFKKAVGDLYKQRKITIEADGIKIV